MTVTEEAAEASTARGDMAAAAVAAGVIADMVTMTVAATAGGPATSVVVVVLKTAVAAPTAVGDVATIAVAMATMSEQTGVGVLRRGAHASDGGDTRDGQQTQEFATHSKSPPLNVKKNSSFQKIGYLAHPSLESNGCFKGIEHELDLNLRSIGDTRTLFPHYPFPERYS